MQRPRLPQLPEAWRQSTRELTLRHGRSGASRGGRRRTRESAMIALDPATGTCARDPGGGLCQKLFNRESRAAQPGSAFKPFVYAEALSGLSRPISTTDQAINARRRWQRRRAARRSTALERGSASPERAAVDAASGDSRSGTTRRPWVLETYRVFPRGAGVRRARSRR